MTTVKVFNPLKRARTRKAFLDVAAVTEAHIQETCDQFLELDGWRIIKTDLKHLRGLGVQEPGMPDRCYIRYEKQTTPPTFDLGAAQVMWIEWKRKGGQTGEHQWHWHRRERARGALVLLAGEHFPASIEGFRAWYAESGLAMRVRA